MRIAASSPGLTVFIFALLLIAVSCSQGDDDADRVPADDDSSATDDFADDADDSADDSASADDTQADDDQADDSADDDSTSDDSADDDTGGSTTTTTTTTTAPSSTTTTVTTTSVTTTTAADVPCYRDRDFDRHGAPGESRNFPGDCPPGWAPGVDDFNDVDFLCWTDAPELPDDGVDQSGDGQDLIMSNTTGVFVAKNGDDANPGTMELPKLTIAAGIALAEAAGKAVFVADGDYLENVNAAVSIFGGYEPVTWIRHIDGTVLTRILPDVGVGVKIDASATVAVSGFVIIAGSGYFNDPPAVHVLGTVSIAQNWIVGGISNYAFGVLVDSGGTAALYRNGLVGAGGEYARALQIEENGYAVAEENDIDGQGDTLDSIGVAVKGTAVLRSNTIYGGNPYGTDSSTWGVFVYAGGDAILTDNFIFGGDPGSIFSHVAGMEILGRALMINNVVVGRKYLHHDQDQGNGIIIKGRATLINNVINGGHGFVPNGIGITDAAEVNLVNNIIDGGGDGDSTGIGIRIDEGASTVVMMNNDIYGENTWILVYVENSTNDEILHHASEVNGCGWTHCVQAGGNLDVDPLLADPPYSDCHIAASSPCKDAGVDPAPWYDGDLADFDFEGDSRPYGSGWDIGADEWTP